MATYLSGSVISSDELAKMLEEYRRDYEARLQSRPNVEAQQARQHIQKARDLIRQSGLGEAVTTLLEEVKYWPSWTQRDDLVKSVHFPATDLRASEESKEELLISRTEISRMVLCWRIEAPPTSPMVSPA